MQHEDLIRVPPNSLLAEQSVLGAMMYDQSKIPGVIDILTHADFYRREHREIFAAIAMLNDDGQAVDIVTVAEHLEARGKLEDAGGLEYLGQVIKDLPSSANVYAYARAVREAAQSRELIAAGQQLVDLGYDESASVADRMDRAQSLLLGIGEQDGQSGGLMPASAGLAELVQQVEERFESEGQLAGLPTGLRDLDDKLSGLRPGNLVIVAGRPAMGKTTLAMGFAEHAALRLRKRVAVFSLEMTRVELLERMTASVGRVNLGHLRSGQLEDDEWPRLTAAVTKIKDAPLWIDETPGLTPARLRARAKRLHRKNPLDLVVVDYIQLMRGEGESQVLRVADISQSLKALAKELQIPVIALSQLNRSVESRPNKRPLMSDLRDSGSIEQDADVILFVYRDEVYDEDSPDKGTAELIVGKHRGGTTGTVLSVFRGEYNRFEAFAPGGDEWA